MNNSEDYKIKYLKYKRDYLNLKEELDGGMPKITSQAILYIILDVDTYNLITTIIKRSILSIQFIDTILTGSALKITEGSNKINFLQSEELNMMMKHYKRRSNALIGISIPEYKFTSESKSNQIGTIREPYKLGNVYNSAGFINKMTKIIKEKLLKRNPYFKINDNKLNKYDPIEKFDETKLPFYAVILFDTDSANCIFMEAYKLVKTDEQDILNNNNTIAIIETEPALNVHLVKDDTIFNLQSPFIIILDDNDKTK